jgi:hypothetical protein
MQIDYPVISKVIVPQDFTLGPVFRFLPKKLVSKSDEQTQLSAKKRRITTIICAGTRRIEIGGFDPYGREIDLSNAMFHTSVCPTLYIDHFRMLCVLTYLVMRSPTISIKDARCLTNVTLNDLYTLFQGSSKRLRASTPIRNKLKNLLDDLEKSWIRVTDIKTGKQKSFKIVTFEIKENAAIHTPNKEKNTMVIENLRFTDGYIDYLNSSKNMPFRVDVISKMRSDLSRVLYTYLPSRAIHAATPQKAFCIKLDALLDEIGASNEHTKKWASFRHAMIKDIVEDLDLAPISRGFLRIKLDHTKDRSDYLVKVWSDSKVEEKVQSLKEGKLYLAYTSNGKRTAEDYMNKVRNVKPLDSFEQDYLKERIRIKDEDLKKIEGFLIITKALLGSRFHEALGGVNELVNETTVNPRFKIKSLRALCISELLKYVEAN